MDHLGSVQQKVSCIFETEVLEEPSAKRSYQQYKVLATNDIRPAAVEDGIQTAIATEKLDGTCVCIQEFNGQPWLWARLDRKPNKAAEKKFKKYQSQQKLHQGRADDIEPFSWDVDKDFKDVPENWIPAKMVPHVNDKPLPDANGHIPGWVPVDPKSRQHCWHLNAVDLKQNLGLVLRESDEGGNLEIHVSPLSELNGHTAELIGTHINANPYGIGTKQYPIHMLVVHGSIKADVPSDLQLDKFKQWFSSSGHVEGVVWHCHSGMLYKLHRHHLNLPWPINEPSLSCRRVHVNADISQCGEDVDKKTSLWTMSRLSGCNFDSLKGLAYQLRELDGIDAS